MKKELDKFGLCEYCGEYCADEKHKCRLIVELPPDLQFELGKDKAALCFDCVKEYCKDTLGRPLKDRYGRPILDSNGVPKRSNYWYGIIFGEEELASRYD